MTTTKHEPTTLSLYGFGFYNWSKDNCKVEFQSNKGNTVSTKLLPEEVKTIEAITEAARLRAMKEVPEMIAEIIAEERVKEILRQREEEALALEAPKVDPVAVAQAYSGTDEIAF